MIALTKPEQTTLLATELRAMKSEATGTNYQIPIALPFAYSQSMNIAPYDKPLTAWPVIYLLDSDVFFGMVTDTVRVMAHCGRTTDAIIVGIGYRKKFPQRNHGAKVWPDGRMI